MTKPADDLFFSATGLDRSRVEGLVGDALHGAEDGELFLEYRQSEALAFDDGRLKTASFDTTQGFGLRCVSSEMRVPSPPARMTAFIPTPAMMRHDTRRAGTATASCGSRDGQSP